MISPSIWIVSGVVSESKLESAWTSARVLRRFSDFCKSFASADANQLAGRVPLAASNFRFQCETC
jgi:hypothetical protein